MTEVHFKSGPPAEEICSAILKTGEENRIKFETFEGEIVEMTVQKVSKFKDTSLIIEGIVMGVFDAKVNYTIEKRNGFMQIQTQ